MKRLAILLLTATLIFSIVVAEETDVFVPEEDEVVIITSELKELKYGDKGDEVRALQTRLRDVKYYTAKVTGNYYKSTTEAVKKVQEAYALPVTGEADAATLQVIYGDCHRPLKSGSQGKDVSRLQTMLGELGYYSGNISGKYFKNTQAAVQAFQTVNGLNATGEADVFTQEKLYSGRAIMATPDPNMTPTPVPEPTPVPDLSFPGNMSYGSKGERVRQLQERLKELGYFNRKTTTTGYYKMTQAAVEEFQKQNGLFVDGRVDEETWEALYSEDVVLPFEIPKPTKEPKPPEYFLEVDVNNQLIKVFGIDEEGNYSKFLRAMWCSTGTTGYPSDVGTFTLTKRRALWAEFPNWGGGKARYWVSITPSIAFHSFIYSSYNTKSVNLKSVNRLGRRASHGCIRLTLQDAKWVYQNCGEGTQVYIHEDAPIDAELKSAHRPATYDKKLYAHPTTPAPSVAPPYNPAVLPGGEIRALKLKSKGEDVYWLQNRLKELGYYQGAVTGEYLDGTKQAVSKFQKDNGIKANGTADKKTIELLYSQAMEEYKTPAPLPTDAPPTPSPTEVPPTPSP